MSSSVADRLAEILEEVRDLEDESTDGCRECDDNEKHISDLEAEVESQKDDLAILVEVRRSIRDGDTEAAISLIDRVIPRELRYAF